MGSSVTAISNEISRAIDDLRKIINGSSFEKPKEKASDHEKKVEKLSNQQLEILKRRMEEKSSFKFIAQELKLSEKQVHLEFLQAYSYLQNQKNSVIPF
ncbi:hypothetical protein [Elizabethkingia anophelis]|nr:hypothetical protein [Elizabethkingia anophelis]